MGHFVEFVMELLFGLAKDSPEKMPEIEYKDRFVVKHPRKKALAGTCAALVFSGVFSALWILVKDENRYLFAAFAVLGFLLLILFLFPLSFRCCIDENELSRSVFWLFKKKIKWQDIICVRIVETTNEKAVIIALYDQAGKCVIDFNTDMENAWYIAKMAEHKLISIKHEKDMSVKQLSHL